jgi:hypothetical protein
MRPASLKERTAFIRKPGSRFEPPREPVEAELLINGFLFSCASCGIVGPRDLKELKGLYDMYAESENASSLVQWKLAQELAARGIAHQQRELQPYETEYEVAVLETGSPRPQVTFFVIPPVYPIRPNHKAAAGPPDPEVPSAQAELFPGAEPTGGGAARAERTGESRACRRWGCKAEPS